MVYVCQAELGKQRVSFEGTCAAVQKVDVEPIVPHLICAIDHYSDD